MDKEFSFINDIDVHLPSYLEDAERLQREAKRQLEDAEEFYKFARNRKLELGMNGPVGQREQLANADQQLEQARLQRETADENMSQRKRQHDIITAKIKALRKQASSTSDIKTRSLQKASRLVTEGKKQKDMIGLDKIGFTQKKKNIIKFLKSEELYYQVSIQNLISPQAPAPELLTIIPELSHYHDVISTRLRQETDMVRNYLMSITHSQHGLNGYKVNNTKPTNLQLWERICSYGEDSSAGNIENIKEEMRNLQVPYQNFKDVRKILERLFNIFETLDACGAPLTVREQVRAIKATMQRAEINEMKLAKNASQPVPSKPWMDFLFNQPEPADDSDASAPLAMRDAILKKADDINMAMRNSNAGGHKPRNQESANLTTSNDESRQRGKEKNHESRVCAFCGYANHDTLDCKRMQAAAKKCKAQIAKKRKEREEKRQRHREQNEENGSEEKTEEAKFTEALESDLSGGDSVFQE